MVAILLFAFGLPLGLVYGAFFGLMLLLVVLSFLRRRRLPRRPQAET
jgi:hypothetical protein